MRIVISWSCLRRRPGHLEFHLARSDLFSAWRGRRFPNIAKAFSVWLPHDERVRAQGIVWLSARWGGAFTPPLVFLVFQYVTWRTAFALFGS